MKKTVKKLVLARETVRRLGGEDPAKVAGGTATNTCTNSNYVDCPLMESVTGC